MFNPYPEPQLKEHSNKLTFKVSPKPCRSRTSKANKIPSSASALSPGATLEPLGDIHLQIA